MTEPLGILLVFLVVGACVLALFVVLAALFPSAVERARDSASSRPGRAFLLGLVNFVFVAAIIAILAGVAQRTGFQAIMVVALILLILLVIGLSFGMAGMAGLLGVRLFPAASPLKQQTLGALALTLACAAPYVGWFGLLPYIGMRGLGGFLLGWFSARNSAEVVAG